LLLFLKYDFTIVYKPNIVHVIANALSRLHITKTIGVVATLAWARNQGKRVIRLKAKRKPGSQSKEVARVRAKKKPGSHITYSQECKKV
jgi:hypothetical protein